MLHPDIEAFLDLADAGRTAPFHQLQPAQARQQFRRATEQMAWSAPLHLRVQEQAVQGRGGAALNVRLYRPAAGQDGPLPVLVYWHGGGFVVGSLDSHDGVCRELCARAGIAVLAVGYRLAPEYRFPVALEDSEDVLFWLADEARGLGLDLARVAFGGDSAGATLATVLAIQAAHQGAAAPVQPKAQLLCYPVTDASRQSVSRTLFDEGYLLENQTLEWFYDHYARTPQDRLDWRFSPLLAERLEGLAPALVLLAGFDPLLDEGRAYADKLAAAGCEVQRWERPDLTHDLLRMGAMVPDVFQVYDQLSQWLVARL